jgi:hypothetical protein
MALRAMATISARNLGQAQVNRAKPPTGKELLETIGTYIPTDISTLYIAVAGGIAAIEPSVGDDVKRNVAGGFTVLAAFAMWVLVHRAAQKEAKDPAAPPNLVQSLIAGLYEIIAAPIAMFAWAMAMPDSWVDWGVYSAVGPMALVGITTVVIGGLAVLLNRNRVE